MNNNWPQVPEIVDGQTTLNNAGLQPIIDALTARTNVLRSAAATVFESGTVINDTGFQHCTKGQLVFFNPDTNGYAPAQPIWTMDSEMRVIPAPEAYIAGIVYSAPDATRTAQLAISGILDASVIPGVNAAGAYYLGADGTLTQKVTGGMLPIYCGYRTSSGLFVFKPQPPVYTGHQHTFHTLSGGTWSGTSGAYTYTPGTDQATTELLNSLPLSTLTVVCDGIILKSSQVSRNDSGLLTLGVSSTPTDVTLFAISPLATLIPEVQAIAPASGNNLISAEQLYGTVYLDTEFPVLTTTDTTGSAITAIERGGIRQGAVVHSLIAGSGINIVAQKDSNNVDIPGSFQISARAFSDYIDFQTINANSVLIGGNSSDSLITFPAGIASSVLGIARIPAVESEVTLKVFVWVLGSSAGLSGSINIQSPPENGSILINTTTNELTINGTGTIDDTYLSELLSVGSYTAYGNSLVTVTLTAVNPGASIRVRAVGLKLIYT